MKKQENEIKMEIPGTENLPKQQFVDKTELSKAVRLIFKQIDNEYNFLEYLLSDKDSLIKEAYDNTLSQKQIKQVSKIEGDFNEDLWVELEDDIKNEYNEMCNFIKDELSIRTAVKDFLNEYTKE